MVNAGTMFGLGRSSLKIETGRRQSEREGSGSPKAEKSELDECRFNSLSTIDSLSESLPERSLSVASLESLESQSTEGEISPPSLAAEGTESDAFSTSLSVASAEGEVLLRASSRSDFRKKFFHKLAANKVWEPEVPSPPKHQTIVIYDWDDTLMPTSWLHGHRLAPLLRRDEECVQVAVQHAKRLLEIAVKAGHTYIITNAQSGWVEYSAARWGPELLPVLRKVKIISARDKFEAAFPNDIWQWKIQAFLEVQRYHGATPFTNLVALGDADYEMEAARIMGGEFEEGLVKTVKFRKSPDPEYHRMQLELAEKNFEKLIGSVSAAHVSMDKKV